MTQALSHPDMGREDTPVSGAPLRDGLSSASPIEPQGGSTKGFNPSRDEWFCDQGDFWGTIKQLCLCAKCGGSDNKPLDQPRHYAKVLTPQMHMLCDACFDSLPEGVD